jgi:hypothetical protein
MGKCRPLSSDEAEAIKAHTHDSRDRCLLIALEKTGIVNLMGIFAEAAREVGCWVHFEAIFSPKVGRLSIKVGVSTGRVEDVLPPTR